MSLPPPTCESVCASFYGCEDGHSQRPPVSASWAIQRSGPGCEELHFSVGSYGEEFNRQGLRTLPLCALAECDVISKASTHVGGGSEDKVPTLTSSPCLRLSLCQCVCQATEDCPVSASCSIVGITYICTAASSLYMGFRGLNSSCQASGSITLSPEPSPQPHTPCACFDAHQACGGGHVTLSPILFALGSSLPLNALRGFSLFSCGWTPGPCA